MTQERLRTILRAWEDKTLRPQPAEPAGETWDVENGKTLDDLSDEDATEAHGLLQGSLIPGMTYALPSGLTVTEAWLSEQRDRLEGWEQDQAPTE